ncbi:MAG TPA: hypothetical protein VGE60_00790 [Telluria sp.]
MNKQKQIDDNEEPMDRLTGEPSHCAAHITEGGLAALACGFTGLLDQHLFNGTRRPWKYTPDD